MASRLVILVLPDIRTVGHLRSYGNQQSRQVWERRRPRSSAPQVRYQRGRLVVAEERPDGILIRPAVALPVEIYTPERKAEFLLSNAVDAEDYLTAVAEVKKMGLEPAKIRHHKPRKRSS